MWFFDFKMLKTQWHISCFFSSKCSTTSVTWCVCEMCEPLNISLCNGVFVKECLVKKCASLFQQTSIWPMQHFWRSATWNAFLFVAHLQLVKGIIKSVMRQLLQFFIIVSRQIKAFPRGANKPVCQDKTFIFRLSASLLVGTCCVFKLKMQTQWKARARQLSCASAVASNMKNHDGGRQGISLSCLFSHVLMLFRSDFHWKQEKRIEQQPVSRAGAPGRS